MAKYSGPPKLRSAIDLTIVLFNCDSARENGRKVMNEETRRECVRQVLDSLPLQTDPNLFVLVQNNITRPMHRAISESALLTQDARPATYNREAEVYKFSNSDRYHITYVERLELQRVSDILRFSSSSFAVSSLTACVVTDLRGRHRILLVSWHGPYKKTNTEKIQCFDTLVDFLAELRVTKYCFDVMVGGGFDLPADVARAALAKKPHLKGAVCDGYANPSAALGSSKVDYIVRWPVDHFQQRGSPSVIDPDFETASGNEPFDHPIVSFRFQRNE